MYAGEAPDIIPAPEGQDASSAGGEGGLVYAPSLEGGITRREGKRGFLFYDAAGRRIRDPETLARVTALACPLLVSLIEDGAPSEEIKKLVVREYLRPLRQQNIDTLLLGCTHYPMIASLIQEEMGNSVTIVDPAQALADVIAPMLPSLPDAAAATYRFFTSDDAERFAAIGETFLGIKMGMVLNKRTG